MSSWHLERRLRAVNAELRGELREAFTAICACLSAIRCEATANRHDGVE